MQSAPDPKASWRDELVVELVPHVVHRLGNQLTVVLGTSDLLALLEQDADKREQLEAVAQSARGATELVRGFGLRARSAAEPPRAQDLTYAYGATEMLLDPVAKAGGYELHGIESRGMALVSADGAALELLVLGLLVSLVRPCPDRGRREGHLRVRAVELGERVALVATVLVQDGGGLEPIDLDPRAVALAADLGGTVHQRVHPGGQALTLILGMPVLDPDA